METNENMEKWDEQTTIFHVVKWVMMTVNCDVVNTLHYRTKDDEENVNFVMKNNLFWCNDHFSFIHFSTPKNDRWFMKKYSIKTISVRASASHSSLNEQTTISVETPAILSLESKTLKRKQFVDFKRWNWIRKTITAIYFYINKNEQVIKQENWKFRPSKNKTRRK